MTTTILALGGKAGQVFSQLGRIAREHGHLKLGELAASAAKIRIALLVLAIVFLATVPMPLLVRAAPGPGDADGDGRITERDLEIVELVITGTAAPRKWHDANEDGSIDEQDLAWIRMRIDNVYPTPMGFDVFRRSYGSIKGDRNWHYGYLDLNRDERVTIADYSILYIRFGKIRP